MKETVESLIRNLNLDVIETIEIEGREEKRSRLPNAILSGPAGVARSDIFPMETVWRHQAIALDLLLAGKNVVVATGTASGKSLIFQLYAFHKILSDNLVRVMVFYPLKALASDQFERWRTLAESYGLPESAVVQIDGDVLAAERTKAMEQANIVLMTPDVCQAWFMRNVASAPIRRFLEALSVVVLDEAHVYESVFGSNVAYLLRRMISAKKHVMRTRRRETPIQIIGATATIRDPAIHLHSLTGVDFEVVDDSLNGAPFHPRTLVHVNGEAYGSGGEAAVVDLARGILSTSKKHRFIAFLDSRQGVERVVGDIGSDKVLPYRSGYEAKDRRIIETKLRTGALDGVASTSALELGIDIADMDLGINLGVPESRKAFRQRIGRVGRRGPAAFFVVAPASAFRKFGETFRNYYDGSIEPSYLYLGNRFIQFAHARCLLDENEVLKLDPASTLSRVEWPENFEDVVQIAKPGAGRPREFDLIAQIGSDNPHFNYPLRQVGEASFQIREGARSFQQSIGNIATHQAIREAYPGAIYLHMGRAYKVKEWQTRSFERSIRVQNTKKRAPIRPILRKTVNFSLDRESIIGNFHRKSEEGLVAEVHLQVNESVEGYRVGGTPYLYKDLRAEDPNMSRKQRDFRTTGVIIQISKTWFSGTKNASTRALLAEAVWGMICREKSISPRDVDATHTNIAVLTEAGPNRLTDSIVVYDSVYGGLRLTEDLFTNFEKYIEQIDRAAKLAGTDAIVDERTTKRLVKWTSKLQSTDQVNSVKLNTPDGWLQIYSPGSIVSILLNGNFVDRELIEPKLADPFLTGHMSLFYIYKSNSTTAFVPHEQVQATGQDWSWIFWNPETSEFKDFEAPE